MLLRFVTSLLFQKRVRHIKDAMKLQRIPMGRKVECYLVPIMLSATKTAEELSAAATVRGIDNPKKRLVR